VHVKLTINAEGSKGADVKHKVFWVSGCETPGTTTTTKPTTSTSGTTTTTRPTSTSGTTTTTGGSGTSGETSTTAAVGGSSSSAAGGSSSSGGGVLPFTGAGMSLPMLVGAIALLGLGAATLRSGSRRRRHP
jgi:hypothetical protein